MADDNKPLKYMRYAVGEIVLVVIGILIALQINNSNNYRQQRNIEQEYLLSLQTEFKTNLNKLNDCLTENTERVNATEDMLALFDNEVRDTINEKAISDIIHLVLGGEATFKPSKGVITDIISSGKLNLIRNQKLRQNLASFESALDFLKLHENGIRYSKNEMKKQLKDRGSIRKVLKHRGLNFDSKSISDTLSNKQIFVFVEFENIILDYYLQIKSANGPRFYGGIKEQIELILDEVDSEIKK